MQSLNSGKKKNSSSCLMGEKKSRIIKAAADCSFLLGTAAVIIMILLSVSEQSTERAYYDDAVYTFAQSWTVREELAPPKRAEKASADGTSVFDCIGEMFAELIFGGRGER